MSDLERLEGEPITESPTLLPHTEVREAEPAVAAEEPATTSEVAEGAVAESTSDTPKKRRRRGSRGGRRRRKPTTAGPGAPAAGTPADDGDAALDETAFDEAPEPADDSLDDSVNAEVDEPFIRAEDYTDPAADRGLTDDDIADQAREDAGLPPHPNRVGPAKPRIGD